MITKKLYLLLAAAALLLVLGLLGKHLWLRPAQPAISTAAVFASRFPDSQNRIQALDQWRGKVAVINFWATWCGPCREEMPELSQLQLKYAPQELVVVGIATDDVAKIAEFQKEVHVSYPLLAGDMQAMDLAEKLGNDRSILPYTAIVDQQGRVVKTYFGRINQALLLQTLLPLLAKRSSSAE